MLISALCHSPSLKNVFTSCLHSNEMFCCLRHISRFSPNRAQGPNLSAAAAPAERNAVKVMWKRCSNVNSNNTEQLIKSSIIFKHLNE